MADDGYKFDRIDVSNIVDVQYVGSEKVLSTFGPLLNDGNKDAVLVSLYMNVFKNVPEDYLKTTVKELMPKKTMDEAKAKFLKSPHSSMIWLVCEASSKGSMMYNFLPDFEKIIAPAVNKANQLGLRRRSIHRLVPKRIFGSLEEGKQDKPLLPGLSKEDEHILSVVSGAAMREIFVEWERI